ncbi:MAG: FAD-binding oxidoreductase [Pseudomonadota bacterium]
MSGESKSSYDVIIVGGAMMGSSAAWFLTDLGFDGRIAVIERDPSYSACSTAHTNSCLRQQFSTEINIKISQFGAAYLKDFRSHMGGDVRIPKIAFDTFGYMYLASSPQMETVLRQNIEIQVALGAGTILLSPQQIAERFPFYALDDILLGSFGTRDEGYFDGTSLFTWWRRRAREVGVDFIDGEVVSIDRTADRVDAVLLGDGTRLNAGLIINAAGPRAAGIAAMSGLELPVEPRKRFSWVFSAEESLPCKLPLTIDPCGVHVRSDGVYFLAGAAPSIDHAVDPDDFSMDPDIWVDRVWPALATRIPAFERIRVVNEWAGHYAYNVLDQNAVVGPHPDVSNFFFLNGFSGHGFQQAAAMGRGLAELVTTGRFQTLDLGPLGYARIQSGTPFVERAVI